MVLHYLNGMDWIIHGTHNAASNKKVASKLFMVILELDKILEEKEFLEFIIPVLQNYPMMCGVHARNMLNLAPYWRYSDSDKVESVLVKATNVEKKSELYEELQQFGNTPLPSFQDHIAFKLIYLNGKTFFATKFDHALFDGRGGEGFLALLQRHWLKEDTFLEENCKKEPSGLTQWMDKFMAGQNLNRHLISLCQNAPARTLPPPDPTKNHTNILHHTIMSPEETKRLDALANKHAGLFMTLPYILSKVLSCFHKITSVRGIKTGDYIIPITIDPRREADVIKKVFFNNWSMLILKITEDEVLHPEEMIKSIKQQIYDNISKKHSENLNKAGMLIRIVPFNLMPKVSRLALRGNSGSFSFSYLKQSIYKYDDFLGIKVTNVFHLPNMPVEPGLGVFFNRFKERLNISFSYTDTILTDEEKKILYSELSPVALSEERR